MGNNTPNLNLYKANPKEDGESTFNIDTILNDNWDKIDEFKQEYNKLEDEVLNPKMAKTEKQVASIINLPNAVDGQASVGVGGRTLSVKFYDNFVKDSNADGLADGWVDYATSKGATLSIANGRQRITANSADISKDRKIYKDFGTIEAGKYYVLLLNSIKDDSTVSWVRLYASAEYLANHYPANGTSIIKFSPTITEMLRVMLYNYANLGNVGNTDFDNIRVYEISSKEYNCISNGLAPNELLQKYPYISGTKSTTNTKIKSVGKNLFNGYKVKPYLQTDNVDFNGETLVYKRTNTNTYSGAIVELKLKKGFTYYINYNQQNSTSYYKRLLDSKLNFVDWVYGANSFVATEKDMYLLFTEPTAGTDDVIISNIQLEEGSTATPYEPYKESISYITLPEGVDGLHSLPNGVKDEVTADGKLIKVISNWETGLSTKNWIHYAPNDTDEYWNVYINRDIAFPRAKKSESAMIFKNVGNGYQYNVIVVNNVHFYIPKSEIVGYISTEKAREWFANQTGIALIYQLAETQVYDLAVTPITCFKDGTIYIESAADDSEYVVAETQITYPINTAGALNSNTMAINQLSNQYQRTREQQLNVSDKQKLQMLGQQITQLKLGGM